MKPKYIFIPLEIAASQLCDLCDLRNKLCIDYPCQSAYRKDKKNGYYKKA